MLNLQGCLKGDNIKVAFLVVSLVFQGLFRGGLRDFKGFYIIISVHSDKLYSLKHANFKTINPPIIALIVKTFLVLCWHLILF